jgi:hypothetical protein
MKTDVASTSIEAFHAEEAAGRIDGVKERIYRFMLDFQAPVTRQQLAEYLDIGINVVCGRVCDLLEEKRIEVAGGVREDHNGRKCHKRETLLVKPGQMKLFGHLQAGKAIERAKAEQRA